MKTKKEIAVILASAAILKEPIGYGVAAKDLATTAFKNKDELINYRSNAVNLFLEQKKLCRIDNIFTHAATHYCEVVAPGELKHDSPLLQSCIVWFNKLPKHIREEKLACMVKNCVFLGLAINDFNIDDIYETE